MTFTSRKLLLIGAATAVMAQAAAADILKGTVTDASGEAALQGAIVTIEELGRTASSDRFGLGFLLNTEPVTGGRAPGSLAWAGLYNTYFWVDRRTGVSGVLLTQVLPFYDGPVVTLLDAFERAVYDSVRAGS